MGLRTEPDVVVASPAYSGGWGKRLGWMCRSILCRQRTAKASLKLSAVGAISEARKIRAKPIRAQPVDSCCRLDSRQVNSRPAVRIQPLNHQRPQRFEVACAAPDCVDMIVQVTVATTRVQPRIAIASSRRAVEAAIALGVAFADVKSSKRFQAQRTMRHPGKTTGCWLIGKVSVALNPARAMQERKVPARGGRGRLPGSRTSEQGPRRSRERWSRASSARARMAVICPAPRSAGKSGLTQTEPPTKRLDQNARWAAGQGNRVDEKLRPRRGRGKESMSAKGFNLHAQIKPLQGRLELIGSGLCCPESAVRREFRFAACLNPRLATFGQRSRGRHPHQLGSGRNR